MELSERRMENMYCLDIMARSCEETKIPKYEFITFCHEPNIDFLHELRDAGLITFSETKEYIKGLDITKIGMEVVKEYLV